MGLEIERKFLVKGEFKKHAIQKIKISQGFLSTVPERTVRIRLTNEKGFITVKGIGNNSGTTRFEWEKEISKIEAESLLKLCEPNIIEKYRYIVPVNNDLFFEVDEFIGLNKGLVVAEIELPSENTVYEKPIWLGKEVTGKKQYYNSAIAQKPFNKW
ncbi:CYTH domain-containing protein [uncultured Lutibacter sp.]|uniref:CYTH domain-containing protein n=1 Tax=uncultured Lutibacter sp. TaxID=437739 RepID=UPI0026311D63|nr:CYTH domain-containing protein [uncultured Lutibacter sp.]